MNLAWTQSLWPGEGLHFLASSGLRAQPWTTGIEHGVKAASRAVGVKAYV